MVGGGVYTSGFDARHAVVYAHLSFPPAIPRTSLPRYDEELIGAFLLSCAPSSGTSVASSGIGGGGGGGGNDDSGSNGNDDDDDGG